MEREPSKGSPCSGCVEKWLTDRGVWCEKRDLSNLMVKRELIAELVAENSPHIFYEIYNDGTQVRLESIVYPHPDCVCDKLNYVPPKEVTRRVNFAFSPIHQLKVVRFGTPDGNLWLATAVGNSPINRNEIIGYGADADKDAARFRAVDEWTKKAIQADLEGRLERGEVLPSEVLQTGNVELITKAQSRKAVVEGFGVGSTRNEAILDALNRLSLVRTLKKYANAMKSPMLIVGTNNWIRGKVPFFLLQQYDLHLLFYPNSTQSWVVGLAAVSRIRVDEKPVFVFAADATIGTAMQKLFCQLLIALRPGEDGAVMPTVSNEPSSNRSSKLNMWWTHWLYRCPKIALKDVLHLDPYPRSLETWKEYFRDGQEPVQILSTNHPDLPSQLRTVVKLQVSTNEVAQTKVRSIMGIGTWSDFSDALA